MLLVLGIFVFAQVLSFDFVPYDDPVMVTGNGYVKDGFTPTTLIWAFFHAVSGKEVAHAGVNNPWHPLHVEPVAWISSRKEVLFGFFEHAALLLGLWGACAWRRTVALMVKPLAPGARFAERRVASGAAGCALRMMKTRN